MKRQKSNNLNLMLMRVFWFKKEISRNSDLHNISCWFLCFVSYRFFTLRIFVYFSNKFVRFWKMLLILFLLKIHTYGYLHILYMAVAHTEMAHFISTKKIEQNYISNWRERKATSSSKVKTKTETVERNHKIVSERNQCRQWKKSTFFAWIS